ncbi:uncharacterized protein LOC106083646 [Stomoxys calcitrans]|uniref:DUF243 domain-containing protein n=1 Tax=Stomoxys calcitrans TaxID=35570 RepID=A0A1I8Q398_STOCA|nr:uncharacterized protein LOC106083646 [Stomoxys calcitrans]
MRAFLLVCFIAVTTAQYSYAPQVNSNGPVIGATNSEDLPLQSQVPSPVREEYSKSFYSYSAPEHEFEDVNAGEHIANALKKNLRVVFIKGPDNKGLEEAAIQLAKTAADDRTAIYVLSKQSDIGSLANQLQQLKSTTDTKPEVHFVKYRTQADAENAQRAIQAQYNTLPGASTSSGPDSAPVLDFASKPPAASSANRAAVANPSPPSTSAPPSRGYASPRGSYIPPNKRY